MPPSLPVSTAAFSRSPRSNPQPKSSIFSLPQQRNDREVRVVADRSLDITGSFLGIIVGKDGHRENFFLHERLFTSRSEFLKRAAKKEWLQQKNVILLPEDDPTTFRLYAVLTYTGFLTTKDLPFEWQSLVDVYVLAEKLQDVWARNHIIDAMHSFVAEHLPRTSAVANGSDRFKDYISAASLVQLYEGTPTGSQARKLVVDLFADDGTSDWLMSAGDLLPHEFLFEVAVRLLQKRPYVIFGNMLERPSTHYHEKPEEQKGPLGGNSTTERFEAKGDPSAATVKLVDESSTACNVIKSPLFGPSRSKEPTPANLGPETPSVVSTYA